MFKLSACLAVLVIATIVAVVASGCATGNGTVQVGWRSAQSHTGNAETTVEGGGSPMLEIPVSAVPGK